MYFIYLLKSPYGVHFGLTKSSKSDNIQNFDGFFEFDNMVNFDLFASTFYIFKS